MKTANPMKIKHKLIFLILGITLLTMLISIGFMFFRDLAHFKRDSLNSIQTIANITAINTVAELVFNDREEAVRSLSQLQYLDDFVYAVLFDRDQQFLAGYPQKEMDGFKKSYETMILETEYSDGYFRVMRPVIYKNERVGSIFLRFSSRSFDVKVRNYLVNLAFFSVVLVFIIVMLTLKAQALVSRPIAMLTDFVKRITTERDYSLRIKKSSGDEIGLLYEGFNAMLSVIEDHQRELKCYQEHLEELVSDRTRALSEVNSELIKLIKAIEFSPNIVAILDSEGLIQYVNPKFEEITGFKRLEVQGNLAFFMDPGRHDEASFLHMMNALKNGEDWSGEIISMRKDGSQYWEKISVSCVRDESGQITHYIEVAEDSSSQKAAEAFLLNAKEMAERANRLKSEFLANMSHEIRTPMNAILGYTKLLLEAELDETRRRQLEIINISGENLLVIINDVLDFSKIEANKLELVLKEFSILEMMEHLEKMFSIKAREKQLYMKLCSESPLPPCLYGDRTRLQQILINIIGNAIKFTRDGGVTATFSYKETGRLCVAVQDTGMGIGKEDQLLIFEPFTQADGSATREFGGTGLGLTIAYNLIRLMGGKLDLISKVGKGTTFFLDVPLSRCEENQNSFQAVDPESKCRQRLGRIALIEDCETDRQLISNILERNGFQIIVLENRSDIADLVSEAKADMVIIDIRMDNLDGFAINALLKRDSRTRIIPVIAYSGSDRVNDIVHFGVIDYLRKPVREDDVVELVSSVIKHKDHVRNVFIADSDYVQLDLYRTLLKKFNYSTFSFTQGKDVLAEISSGIIPDLLVINTMMADMDGLQLLEELEVMSLNLPIIVITGEDPDEDALLRLSGKSVCLFRKSTQSLEEFVSFINCFFKYRGGFGQSMVDKWLSRCNTDSELIEIVLSGLRSLPVALARLGDSIQSNRIDEVRFNAHSLKGLATNLYMDEVYEISMQIDAEVQKEKYDILVVRILYQELKAIVQSVPERYYQDKDKRSLMVGEKNEANKLGILIAEDDTINQQLMQDYFNTRGLEVDLAENGQVVLNKLQARPYDLLLLDMQMPVMDGLETIHSIRREPRYNSLHVIALTGHAMRGDREKYLTAGCNDYLAKPVNFNELQMKIDEQIEKVGKGS